MASPSFKCSIVIVAYNCWENIFFCLETIAAQTMAPAEICIINNGSPPTAEQVRIANSFEGVRLFESGSNIGFAQACNLGASYCKTTEWLIFLNPDTLLQPKWIEKMYKATLDNPNCVAFGSRLVTAQDPNVLDGDGDVYHFSGLAWRNNFGRALYRTNDYNKIFSPCAAAAMYRHTAFIEVGGFDQDFFCYLEDVDLGFRLLLLGYISINVNSCPVLHEGSATTGFRSDVYTYYGQRNLIWVYLKNMPFPLLVFLLPSHILMNLLGILKCGMRGTGVLACRGKLDALCALPKILKKRRNIQKSRRIGQLQLWKILNKDLLSLIQRLLT